TCALPIYGSPETVIARLRALRDQTGLTSLLLHYPSSYGHEKTMQSLRLFAERVMPAFPPPQRAAGESPARDARRAVSPRGTDHHDGAGHGAQTCDGSRGYLPKAPKKYISRHAHL